MARDDYGAINVISEEERTALGISGPKPEDDEGVFEQIGKTADKIGETKLGKKIGSILSILLKKNSDINNELSDETSKSNFETSAKAS